MCICVHVRVCAYPHVCVKVCVYVYTRTCVDTSVVGGNVCGVPKQRHQSEEGDPAEDTDGSGLRGPRWTAHQIWYRRIRYQRESGLEGP